jgi:hypothetical protein
MIEHQGHFFCDEIELEIIAARNQHLAIIAERFKL